MEIINLSSVNKLNTILSQKNNPVLVWFYADWCGHCKNMEHEWDKLKPKCKNIMPIAKVRDDMKDKLINNLGSVVQGFPTIVTIKNGKVVATHNSERTTHELLKFAQHNSNKSIKKTNKSIKKKSKRKNKTRRTRRTRRTRA